MVDIATRVWNHKWKIDPIVRSLIDTDFYKLLMCQSVFRNKPDTQVTFSLINRTKSIRLAELVDEGELADRALARAMEFTKLDMSAHALSKRRIRAGLVRRIRIGLVADLLEAALIGLPGRRPR